MTEARLHAVSSRNMYSEHGLEATMSPAIGLVCHAVAVTILAVDWILALAPGFGSTAAGLALAAQQIMTALGLAALAGPQGRACGDVAKLLLAAVLGLVYLGFMTYLVFWYGDLPVRAAWYSLRAHGPWFVVLLASLASLLLFERLVLEINQAGLSWLTILKKREAFRIAFDGFDVDLVTAFDEADIVHQALNL